MIFKKQLAKLSKLGIWDWAIFKLCLVAFALMLAVLIPDLVEVDRWIYLIIWGLAYIYILWRMFGKK